MIINFPKIEKHTVTYSTFIKMMIGLFWIDAKFPISYNEYLANKYDFRQALTEEEFNIIAEIYFRKSCLYCLFGDLYLVAFTEKIDYKEYEKMFFENMKNALIDYKKLDSELAEKKAEEQIKDIKRLKINQNIDSEEKIPVKLRGMFYAELVDGSLDKKDDINEMVDLIKDYVFKYVIRYYKKTTFIKE